VRRQEVSHLGFPGAETPKHQTLNMLHYFGFPPSGFRDMRRQEVSHLGFPGAETPKHQTLNMLHYFRISSIGISGYATTGGLAPGFPGSRNSETPNSKHAPLFSGFPPSGFRDMRRQEVSHLGFPGAETPKHQTLNILHYFGISSIGISGYATTGGLAPGFPGSRNSETPNSKHAPLFRDFLHRDFGICDDRGLAPGFPGSRNSETPNSKHAPLFRDFLHRDFGICDDKRSRTWVSREPKLRNTKL
jgi:hypothetical protein